MANTTNLELNGTWTLVATVGAAFLLQPVNCNVQVAVMDTEVAPSESVKGFLVARDAHRGLGINRDLLGSGYVYAKYAQYAGLSVPICAFRTWTP